MTAKEVKHRKVGIPKFLRYLYQMLENEDPAIIAWAFDGSSIQILDLQAVANVVLPKYFKHSNYASFQRQLNYFGFRKWTKSQTSICTFSHPEFRQNRPDRLCLIKRKNRPERSKPKPVASPPNWALDDAAGRPVLEAMKTPPVSLRPPTMAYPRQQLLSPTQVHHHNNLLFADMSNLQFMAPTPSAAAYRPALFPPSQDDLTSSRAPDNMWYYYST
ncbi:HSF-type DNA-binding protein [Achlya hypogyna]|uniref:HSF-type DNA-binding protein n=1 Tax=Achlya hypogyna TaxID=1202772 RepID=A0A1V9Y686_ACHHY|nr:HSF-type DNA-binding protein [Achlya hypogyna]